MKKLITGIALLTTVAFFGQNTFEDVELVGLTYVQGAPTHSVESEQLRIGRSDSDIRYHSIYSKHTSGSENNFLDFRLHTGSSDLTEQKSIMVLNGKGEVGIGTQNPDSPLTVKGKIHCEEVQVDLSVPADYVFQKYYTGASELKESYTMPTLEEVAAYTEENHHLPSIPSAKTIQEEGLHLKEMTNLLLQKIEELTLYTIEQEKRIKTLEGKLATEK